MFVVLKVITGPRQGEVFRLNKHENFVVGRSRQAHLRFADNDPYFSRMHFMVEANPPACRLVDLGSRNGTLVNGQKVREAELHHGDVIRAGHTTIMVEVEGVVTAPVESSTYAEGEVCHIPEAPPGYRFIEVIGRGGMGQVWKAVRASDHEIVALKILLPDRPLRDRDTLRFLREANLLKSLTHPHIIRVLDMGEDQGKPWLALEYINGPDLAHVVHQKGKLHFSRATSIMLQVLDGLAYAHDQGVIHRDLKPANILLGSSSAGDCAHIADFGLAKAWQGANMSSSTLTGNGAGTPAYMPPEQVVDLANVKETADQYSAAATFYAIVTGHHCHSTSGGESELFRRILTEAPRRISLFVPDLPVALADAIHRALSSNPADRFPSVREFAEAIAPFATASPVLSDDDTQH